MSDSFQNQFLISLRALKDDYFADSVSLLVDHNDDGALGLVINRPLKTKLKELFPDVSGRYDCPVLEGGPVEQNRIFFLHDGSRNYESTFKVSDNIFLTTSADFINDMNQGEAPQRALAILGYAGWGEQQLESELAENVWLLAPTNDHIVFDVPFEDRPQAAAAMLGVDLNLISPSVGHD